MKKILLFLMAIAMVTLSSSATKIYVCGTKITGTTSFSAGGGTVNYNASSNTLTISNVDYTKTGSSNNGISVDEVSGPLTINLVGNVKFDIGDADAVLCKSGKATYINVSGMAYLYCRSQSHAALKLQDGDVTVQGNGEFHINHVAYGHAVKGGSGSEKLTLQIKTCCIYSYDTRLHNLNKVTINPTGSFGSDDYSTKIVFNTFTANAGYATASSVSSWSAGTNVKILKPLEYYNYNISNLTSTVFSHEVVVTDITPVAVFNSTYFPDDNFRSYLLGLYSKGYITTSDVNSRTSMSPSGKYILTLQGIGYFNKLTTLDCSNNGISSLDLSALTQLKTLNASSNTLTSINLPSSLETLNLSNNKKFTTFNMCYNSALKSVDLSGCTSVTSVNMYNNTAMTTLNVSNCSALTTLNCYNDKLSSLSLSGCSSLTSLDCHNNQFTSLSNIPSSVQTLNCSSNKFSGAFTLTGRSNLKTLDISSNPSITTLNCYNNALTNLNAQNCSALSVLDCFNNALTSLNVQGCTALSRLDCDGNQLTSLNVNNLSNLTVLKCYNNNLTSLNLTGCSALTYLSCHNNQITSFTNLPTTLQTIYCNDNKLSGGTFDVSGRSALKILYISNNPNFSGLKCNNCSLTSLNVSGCTGLTTLICNNNQLTSLDVSSLSNLTELNCNWNKLGTLNVSNKTKLTSLNAGYNQLTSLNVQGCSVLNNLYLESNKLTSLSVQGCNALRTINCCLNKISASGANRLINNLCTIPSGSQGTLRYIFPGYNSGSYVENNVNLTDAQVRDARNKRWTPYKFVSGSGWVEIPVNTAVPGDVNGDGTVTSADITALYDHMLNNDSSHIVNGDQTGDGIITSADITAVYTIMLNSK